MEQINEAIEGLGDCRVEEYARNARSTAARMRNVASSFEGHPSILGYIFIVAAALEGYAASIENLKQEVV